MQSIITSTSFPAFLWLFLAILWGTTWPVVRIGLEDLAPFTFAGIRFVLASVVLALVAWTRRAPLPRSGRDWTLAIGTGVSAIGVSYACQFWGMQYVEGGVAAVIFSTVPLWTLLLAHVLLSDEPLTLARLVGVLLGGAGVALIFSDRLGGGGSAAPWAVAGFLVAALALAHAQVVLRAQGHRLDPVVLAALQTGVGGVVLLALGHAVEGPLWHAGWTPRAVGSVAYLSLVGTALGFVALYVLLRRMPVTRVNSMMLVHPLVAIALGWVLLGERLGWTVLLGGAAIMSGLVPLLWPSRRIEAPAGDLALTGEFQVEGAEP